MKEGGGGEGEREKERALQAGADTMPQPSILRLILNVCVCVYYCCTYYRTVRVGGGGKWRTCATRDDVPRPLGPVRNPVL